MSAVFAFRETAASGKHARRIRQDAMRRREARRRADAARRPRACAARVS